MAFWLRLFLLLLIVGAVLTVVFHLDVVTAVGLGVVVLTALPGMVRQSPRLYLLIQRCRFFLLNTAMTWDLDIRFRGAGSVEKLDGFIEELRLVDPMGTVILQHSNSRRLLRFRRIFTLEFVFADDPDPLTGIPCGHIDGVDVTMFEQQIGFRESQRMLEDTLIPFLEQLRNALVPDSTNYALRVQFGGPNPFLGLYLQQLKPELVRAFQFEFSLPAGDQGDFVRVDREKLEVVSQSLSGFRRAALAGLTFSAASR